MPSSALTRRANQAATADLAVSLPARGRTFAFDVRTASELSDDQRDQIWRMLEDNMRELYRASSFGWHPRKKREEMFHPLSRFVLAHDDALGPTSTDVIAYSVFRFEREDRQDVVYCYELQVSAPFRRSGLGRLLIQTLSDIGARWEMTKVMLTVFKANHAATMFYQAIGFTTDDTSPDAEGGGGGGEDACDYAILSRPVP